MSFYYVPEPNLNPPEDTRRVVYRCRICDGEILEGDDYFDVPDLGPCCEDCISDCKKHQAEFEYSED